MSSNVFDQMTTTSIDSDIVFGADERVVWGGVPAKDVNDKGGLRSFSVMAIAFGLLWIWSTELISGHEILPPMLGLVCHPVVVMSLLLAFFWFEVSREQR